MELVDPLKNSNIPLKKSIFGRFHFCKTIFAMMETVTLKKVRDMKAAEFHEVSRTLLEKTT